MLTFCLTPNDIHLSPKHNQSQCTETHLSLCVNSLPGPDQDSPLTVNINLSFISYRTYTCTLTIKNLINLLLEIWTFSVLVTVLDHAVLKSLGQYFLFTYWLRPISVCLLNLVESSVSPLIKTILYAIYISKFAKIAFLGYTDIFLLQCFREPCLIVLFGPRQRQLFHSC